MPARDERKPVTVLFADLVGSTELAMRHDPESLRALLSAFFDEMRQQIEDFDLAVQRHTLIDAIERSSATGRSVRLG